VAIQSAQFKMDTHKAVKFQKDEKRGHLLLLTMETIHKKKEKRKDQGNRTHVQGIP